MATSKSKYVPRAIYTLTALFAFLFLAQAYSLYRRSIASYIWMKHTYEVLDILQDINKRIWLLQKTNKTLQPLDKDRKLIVSEIDAELDALSTLIGDNPNQQERLNHFSNEVSKKLERISSPRKDFTSELSTTEDSLGNYLGEIIRTEKDLLKYRTQRTEYYVKSRFIYTIVTYGILIIFLFASLYAAFRNIRKRHQSENEALIKESEYKNRMNDITFSALRAQMNPHFIFNCLNSIKLYTEQNNTETASLYLTKFSKLIRNTLDSGRSENITLAKELASLQLYLELEAMRFKDKLQFEIQVSQDVDTDFIELPPLLIQPYVENAIWHGLMHKEEGGHIRIHVSQSADHNLLLITITDDGVGRKKAAAIKSKSATRHKSHGTQVTGERIALINEKYGAGAEAVITDLFTENQKPAGTLVTLKLPIK